MSPTGVAAVAECVCEGRGGLVGRFYVAACKKLIPKTIKYLYSGFTKNLNFNIFAHGKRIVEASLKLLAFYQQGLYV
jgi:hypothetical protein